jgi:hypothetical protein
MNNLSLFLGGAAITLLVGGAIAALIWGAILDGRTGRSRPGGDSVFGLDAHADPGAPAAVGDEAA